MSKMIFKLCGDNFFFDVINCIVRWIYICYIIGNVIVEFKD